MGGSATSSRARRSSIALDLVVLLGLPALEQLRRAPPAVPRARARRRPSPSLASRPSSTRPALAAGWRRLRPAAGRSRSISVPSPEPREQPELGRVEVDAASAGRAGRRRASGSRGGRASRRSARTRAASRFARGREALAETLRAGRLPERHFSQQPRERERYEGDGRREDEHGRQRGRERLEVQLVHRRRQPLDPVGLTASGRRARRRSRSASSVGEPVREDRAEQRDADRAADLPEQRRARRRHAELLVVDRVLRREHEHLHHHAEPETEHQHEERRRQSASCADREQ